MRISKLGLASALALSACAGKPLSDGGPSRQIVSSSSMAPTLLPENLVTFGEVAEIEDLKRGDVVLIRIDELKQVPSKSYSMRYTKRVIGLPGDKIEYTLDGSLFINDKIVARETISAWIYRQYDQQRREVPVEKECIDPETCYFTMQDLEEIRARLAKPETYSLTTGPWQVPEGHLFLIGDFRSNSRDSRSSDFGLVSWSSILGVAKSKRPGLLRGPDRPIDEPPPKFYELEEPG